MPSVEAFTDGACRGNPGPGGWGVVLRSGERVKELSGGEPATTNNRMELKAAIEALTALKQAVPRRSLHRFDVRAQRHHGVAARVACARLAHGG